MLVGVGVLPSTMGITFFWFPPAVAYGILAIFVAWHAFKRRFRQAGAFPGMI